MPSAPATVGPRRGVRLPSDPVERASLLAGLILVSLALVVLAGVWAYDARIGKGLAVQWVAHTAIGKETSIPVGIYAGVPPWLSALASFAQDAIVLLIGYPLAMALGRGTLRWPWLERRVHRPRPRHKRFARRTETVGITLLAASLWLPYLPSGALVAALVGRAAGYRMRILIPVLGVSALVASVTFAVLFSFAFTMIQDPAVWWTVVAVATGLGLVGMLVMRARDRREARLEELEAAEAAATPTPVELKP